MYNYKEPKSTYDVLEYLYKADEKDLAQAVLDLMVIAEGNHARLEELRRSFVYDPEEC